MVKVVFVRFGYDHRPRINHRDGSKWPIEGSGLGSKDRRRGMLVAGYANTGEAFATSEPAFDALVQRIRFPKSTTPEPMPPPGSVQPAVATSATMPPPAASAR